MRKFLRNRLRFFRRGDAEIREDLETSTLEGVTEGDPFKVLKGEEKDGVEGVSKTT